MENKDGERENLPLASEITDPCASFQVVESTCMSDVVDKEQISEDEKRHKNFSEQLHSAMLCGDTSKARSIFNEWEKRCPAPRTLATRQPTVKCPFCEKSIVNLVRHLIQKHKLSEKDAHVARGKYQLRKVRVPKDGKQKQKQRFITKICPIRTCNRYVKRLNNHLRQVHKMANRRIIEAMVNDAKRPMDNVVPEAAAAPNEMPCIKEEYESTQAQLTEDVRMPETDEDTDKIQGTDSESESEDMDGEEESPILTPTVAEKQLFAGLKGWLMSIDGSLKNEKVAQMHVSHVIHINRAVETGLDQPNDIRNLFDAAKVKNHWLNSFLDEKQPGTVKSYLNSLRILCKFLKEYESMVDVTREKIENFEVTISNWMKSLQKRLTIRRWEKRQDDLEKLATKDDFQIFDQSVPVRNAIKVLSTFTGSTKAELRRLDYTCVRDFLATSLLIDNACRSGAIANLALEDVKKAVKDGEMMVMSVLDHKTIQTSGPAVLCLPIVTYTYLDIFINKMRSTIAKISGTRSDKVFLSWTGQPMSSSSVSDQIGAFWRSTTGKHMNASLMRKSCVSQIHKTDPAMKANLASHMNHTVKTAEMHYFVLNKKDKSAKTSAYLRKAMRNTPAVTEKNNDLKDLQIRQLFERQIREGNVKINEVKEVLADQSIIGMDVRAAYDRLRYIIRKESTVTDDAIEMEEGKLGRTGIQCSSVNSDDDELHTAKIEQRSVNTEDVVDEEVQNDKDIEISDQEDNCNEPFYPTKVKYTDRENKEVFKLFTKEITSQATIRKARVLQVFRESKVLAHLVDKLTATQMTDKIHTMRKTFLKENSKNY